MVVYMSARLESAMSSAVAAPLGATFRPKYCRTSLAAPNAEMRGGGSFRSLMAMRAMGILTKMWSAVMVMGKGSP